MAKYVAFLRGINVGGHKIIKMEGLAKIFSSFGFKDVATFIASGNVIFESTEKDSNTLRKKIEDGLKKKLGYEVVTLVRTIDEISALAALDPFRKTNIKGITRTYITFLLEEPDATSAKAIMELCSDIEAFWIKGTEVFSMVRKDTSKKPLFSNLMIEKKLGMSATTRDSNTLEKISALYGR